MSEPASPATLPPRPAAGWRQSPVWWPLAGLVLLVAVNLVSNPDFLAVEIRDGRLFGTPVDIFNRGSYCMMLALGMTLVIATGGIDLSVGSVMAIAGAVAVALVLAGHSLAVVLAAALGAALVCGFINGALVAWVRLQPIVATLVVMVAGRGIAQAITATNVLTIPDGTHGAFVFLGRGNVLGLPFAPLLVIACYLAAGLALRRTAAGLFVEAVGDNETASRFAGLATARVKCLAYGVCGLCAGVAGVLETANIAAADPLRAGEFKELDAIFAVVLGGTALRGGRFYLLGSFVGALLLQTLTVTMFNLGVPSNIAPVAKAFVILVVCLMQSETTRGWVRALAARRRAAA